MSLIMCSSLFSEWFEFNYQYRSNILSSITLYFIRTFNVGKTSIFTKAESRTRKMSDSFNLNFQTVLVQELDRIRALPRGLQKSTHKTEGVWLWFPTPEALRLSEHGAMYTCWFDFSSASITNWPDSAKFPF